jgi:hypothetical protein
MYLVWLQAIVYYSSFDNEYATLDNCPDLASSPSDGLQSVVSLEQNEEGCNELGLNLSTENRARHRCESVSSEVMGSDDSNTSITVEDLEIPSILQMNAKQSELPPLKHFYFYQGNKSFQFIIIVQMVITIQWGISCNVRALKKLIIAHLVRKFHASYKPYYRILLTVSKQRSHRFHVERFSCNELECKKDA